MGEVGKQTAGSRGGFSISTFGWVLSTSGKCQDQKGSLVGEEESCLEPEAVGEWD